MRFEQKVAIITGAASGLGRLYALALAERGAHLVLIDCADLSQTELQISRLNASSTCYQCDITDFDKMDQIVADVISELDHIDILVHCASENHNVAFERLTLANWKRQFAIDVDACFYLTQAVWPYMKQQKYGRIIMSVGASALYGDDNQSCFSSSKMALVGLVNSLSREGKPLNICVNSISPMVNTNSVRRHLADVVQPLFGHSAVISTMLFLASQYAPQGQHLLTAAGSISHGQFAEFHPYYFKADTCTPEKLKSCWHKLYHIFPMNFHESGESQILAWAQRSAPEHGIKLK
ncbi:SDR family NAD(P)-dependent oxidoreductase [Shewanella marina]|uniref:SDR family NAD(P)-dependent oxidoreductase n=1 Tax=Shewanella marina TaxID=487319 RepID=UPI000472037E|nr:SDR family oxidoreductase [Shewanella marina]